MGKPDREIEKGNGWVRNNKWPLVSFLVLFSFILAIFFKFPSERALQLGPYSEHMWRQSDGHAMTYNLYIDSSTFISPRTLDLDIGEQARGGMEFPIMYVLASKCNQILGEYHSSTSNWLHFLILLIGFLGISLSTFFIRAKNDFLFYGISILLLLGIWSSGVFQYYGMNNFPDIAALGFTFLAFPFILKSSSKSYYPLIFSGFCFLLAGLIKVTFLIFPIAILGTGILLPESKKLRLVKSIILLAIIAIVSIWVFYIRAYNDHWNSTGFLTSFLPIWDIDPDERSWIWNRLKFEFLPRVFINPWWYLIFILFVLNLIFLPLKQKLIQVASLAGLIIYILLFYAQFSVHSYYLIVCYPFFLMIIFYFFKYSWGYWPQSFITKMIILVLLMLFNYQQIEKTDKYLSDNYSPSNPHHTYLNLTDAFLNEELVSEFLSRNKVPVDALVISYPDPTTNVSLHTLKRYGWSIPKDNLTAEKINQLHNEGAEYLIHWGANNKIPDLENINLLFRDSLSEGTKLYELQH